jgi:hypothetical protein
LKGVRDGLVSATGECEAVLQEAADGCTFTGISLGSDTALSLLLLGSRSCSLGLGLGLTFSTCS